MFAYIKNSINFVARSLRRNHSFKLELKGHNISFCCQSKTKTRNLNSSNLFGFSPFWRLLMKIRKIHKGLSTEIVRDKKLLRTYAIFTDLSQLYRTRHIHDFNRRIPQLSNTLKISVKTFKKYILILIKKGWAWMDGNSMRFLNRIKVMKSLPGSNNRYYKIPTVGFKDIEQHIRCIAFEENFKHQQHSVNKKVVNYQVKKAKITCEITKKKFIETIQIWRILNKFSACNLILPINKQLTLSRKGMAKVFGLKTANSGSYWAKKLIPLCDKPQGSFSLGKMDKAYFRALQLKARRHTFYKDGEGYVRLPNLIQYNHHRSI
jgi:hypothetical protein